MTSKNPAAPKASIDWELIERFFRAGLLSLREICAEHLAATGVSLTEGAIRQRAKKDGWTRDLKAKIKAKTEELLRKETLRSTATQSEPARSTLTPEDEKATVDANAKVGVAVRMRQREDAKRLRVLAGKLLEELEIQTDNLELFEELGEVLRSEDDRGQDKRNDIYRRVIDSSGRIDSAKKLCEILEKLQKIEDVAYGLGGEDDHSTPLDELLHKIAREKAARVA